MALNDIALVVTMVATLAGIYLGWDARRSVKERLAGAHKDSGDGDSSAAKAVEILLGPLNKRIDDLGKELGTAQVRIATLMVQVQERDAQIVAQQSELDEFRAGFIILTAQMREARIDPRWQPRVKVDAGAHKP